MISLFFVREYTESSMGVSITKARNESAEVLFRVACESRRNEAGVVAEAVAVKDDLILKTESRPAFHGLREKARMPRSCQQG